MQSSLPLWTNTELADDVAFWLRLAEMAVTKRTVDALRLYDLRPALYAVLLVIQANPGRKQHEVGEALRVAPSNLGVLMETLVKRNLIDRDRVPDDVRSYALRLTPKGEALLQAVKPALSEVFADTDRAIGPRRQELISILTELADHDLSAADA